MSLKIETEITKMLGIDLPIVGAPMFLVSYPDLVVAVSEAGGIGTFPALNYRTSAELEKGLEEIRDRTKRPIGVNLIMSPSHNPRWSEQWQIVKKFKVELLIVSLGTPRSIVKEAREIGAKIFCDVTTLRHAQLVTKTGADALIAVAGGAGGHAGNTSPFALVPYLKSKLPLPVLAAGSIGNGRQMAAGMALGADAVYVGTRLVASTEAAAQDQYKQDLIDSGPDEIVYTEKISGIPANWLKSSVDRFDAAEAAKDGDGHDLQKAGKKWKDIWSAGHGVAQIETVEPAAKIVTDMAREYLEVIEQLPRAKQ